MRAWASVLAAAAACAVALCSAAAAADCHGDRQRLLGRPEEHMNTSTSDQLPALSQPREGTSESPQAISSKSPTPQTQSLTDSESALCAEEVAANSEGVNQPLIERAQEPQHSTDQLLALPQPREVASEPVELVSSTPPTQWTQSHPDTRTTLSTTAAAVEKVGMKQSLFVKNKKPQGMLGQVPVVTLLHPIRVTLPKPPTPQTQSLPDSMIQPPSHPRFDLTSDSSPRPTPAFPSQPPAKSPAPGLQQPSPQELPKQPLSELPTHLRKESPTLPPPKLPGQSPSRIPTHPLQELPKTSHAGSQTQPAPNLLTHTLPMSSKQQRQEYTQQSLQLPKDLSTELSKQPPLELTTRQPPVLPNSPSMSPPEQPRPYLKALSQPTTQEPAHSSPESSSQPPPMSSTLRSPQSSEMSPKSSTQQALESPSQSSSETHLPQFTPSSPTQPLPRTTDSGKKCNCFHELPRRRWLDCSNRNRNTIRAADLCNEFPTHVNLSHNSFVSLPENLGENVRSLNLSHNLLTTIPRSPPLHPKMHTLDLSFNRITNSNDELRDMFYLQALYVQGNRLQSLDFLPSPCSLHVLLADHNQLRSLEGPLFYCFLAVEIDLSWNQLDELSKNVIGNLYLLRQLHLVHLSLTSIPPGVFGRSLYLRFVDLSENKLTTLPSRAFDGGFIETILLDKNIISSLPNDTFSKRYPYSIIKISLAQNKLQNIPRGLFSELMSLEHLNLNYNYLRYLPNGIFDGLNLTSIDLRRNLLGYLPQRLFSGLKNLKRIDLGGNQLASVPGDLLAELRNLELLDLSDNVITVPAGLFNGVKSIGVLDLSYNFRSTFSGSQLDGRDHVKWLYLKGNQFTELPVYDDTWPQVLNLNLEENDIKELSEAAVRSWLGDGSQARHVTLGVRQRLRSVGSLRWVVDDPHVTAIVDAADCRCGFVNRGRAHLFFCSSVWCPGGAANWVDEASRTDNQQKAP